MLKIAVISERITHDLTSSLLDYFSSKCFIKIIYSYSDFYKSIKSDSKEFIYDVIFCDSRIYPLKDKDFSVLLNNAYPNHLLLKFCAEDELFCLNACESQLILGSIDFKSFKIALSNMIALTSSINKLQLSGKILNVTSSIGEDLGSEVGMDKLCDTIINHFNELFNPEKTFLIFLDDNLNEFYIKRAYSVSEPIDFNEIRIPFDMEPFISLTNNRKTLVLNPDDNILKEIPLEIIKKFKGRLLFSPMIAENKVKGILLLESDQIFTETEKFYIERLCSQIAITIDYAWLYEKSFDFNQVLEEQVKTRTSELIKSNEQLEYTLKKLKETQVQLIQREKMASLGQLTAGIAHEVNNPLSFVINNVVISKEYLKIVNLFILLNELIIKSEDSIPAEHFNKDVSIFLDTLSRLDTFKDDIKEFNLDLSLLAENEKKQMAIQFLDYVSKVLDKKYSGCKNLISKIDSFLLDSEDGLSRTKQIVLDLRSFSRLDEAEFKFADVDKGIINTINIIKHLAKDKNVSIFKNLSINSAVPCYPSKLNQVIMNLIVNAIQVVDIKGKVEITSANSINLDSIIISVSDNGKGIKKDNLSKIFDPYFTTKPVGEGTGLGLSICYKIIEEHKGKINVESEINKGTTFTIEIPVLERRELS